MSSDYIRSSTNVVNVLVLVYKSFYNTVGIYGHANKATFVVVVVVAVVVNANVLNRMFFIPTFQSEVAPYPE